MMLRMFDVAAVGVSNEATASKTANEWSAAELWCVTCSVARLQPTPPALAVENLGYFLLTSSNSVPST